MEVDVLRSELAQLAAERADVDARLRNFQGRTGRGAAPWHKAAPRGMTERSQRGSLLSAVVSQQPEIDATHPEAAVTDSALSENPLKRPLRQEDNPAQQKRARRMLGSLLGTLQKFRQEEGAALRQELVAKRATILQRAEEKEREESRRLRELERSIISDKCREDQQQRRRLDVLMQEKRLRLAHVTWVTNNERMFTFLETAAAPRVLYLPSRLNEAAQHALQERRDMLTTFQAVDVPSAEARLEDSIRALHAAGDAHAAPMTELLREGRQPEAGEHGDEEGEEGQVLPDQRVRVPPTDVADDGELEEEPATAADAETLADILG